jgi:hypothetical protein
MFGLKKKGPSQPTGPFEHAFGCKVVVADPGFQPEWQKTEEGHWRRICQCYSEDRYEPPVDTRTRLDPLDPSTFRHGGRVRAPRRHGSRHHQSHPAGS